MSWMPASKVHSADDCLSESYVYKMQQERFKIFKSQDIENGHFDVTFEIDGKKLFAHKFIITPISEYMNALLTDRWTTKDEIIKIETYSFDDFYEFVQFLYIGSCNFTAENVFQLTDMSEFYAVPFLKEFCEKFLLDMKYYNVENIEEMFEFAQKYSMKHMEDLIKKFVSLNIEKIISSEVTCTERFLTSKKSFVELLSSVNTGLYSPWNFLIDEKLFRSVYKWTEHQVLKQKNAEDENFNLLEAVKDELRETFPHIYSMDKTKMSKDFLMDFMFEKGIFLSPDEFKSIYERIRCSGDVRFCFNFVYDIAEEQDSEKSYFKDVYFLAEKQALQKQKMNPNESFNLADSIKADLVDIIPIVEFYIMDKAFVMDFIVSKGIYFDIRVSIENNRKTVTGVFKNDILAVSHKVTCLKQTSTNMCRFLKLKFPIPSIKSSI